MERRRLIERWFAGRGVPQLIEGFSTEQRMDQRALPFIAGWIVIGTVLLWAFRPDASLAENGVAMALMILASFAVLGAILLLRRHPPFGSGRLDLVDVAMIGLVPGTAAAVVHQAPSIVIGVAGSVLVGVGIIYLVTGFGLLEVAVWAVRFLRAQLTQIATLVSRTMPVLLILVVFLLFASELWQAAHTLGGADLAAVIALLMLVATVLVVTRASSEVREIEEQRDWAAILALLPGTPAEPLMDDVIRTDAPLPRRLAWQERLNLVLLMLVSQLVQSLFVAVLVLLFLVALGLLAIPASVQETWVGEPARELVGFQLLGEPRLLSVELLVTAGLLGGVSALYFTGLALTDAAFRADFHARVVGDVEQIMAVHAAYLASPAASLGKSVGSEEARVGA
jgi:hypothetical protein